MMLLLKMTPMSPLGRQRRHCLSKKKWCTLFTVSKRVSGILPDVMNGFMGERDFKWNWGLNFLLWIKIIIFILIL